MTKQQEIELVGLGQEPQLKCRHPEGVQVESKVPSPVTTPGGFPCVYSRNRQLVL